MPNRDKTGPEGKGPKTGRGLGSCPETEDQDKPQKTRGTGRGPCGRGLVSGQNKTNSQSTGRVGMPRGSEQGRSNGRGRNKNSSN